jgi:hypothetical protein
MRHPICISLALFASASFAQQPAGTFEAVGTYRGIGALVATIVAPGADKSHERLYASYSYGAKSFDLLSIDPNTGSAEVFHSPLGGEISARSFAVGPNGHLFLGTVPTAHLMELDTANHQIIDRGRPSPTETYIWDVTSGSDHRIYGVTFPNCKLVRYDTATQQLDDLGRLDPTEQYARSIAASSDGFLYIGIGSSKANIAAYNLATGEHREILPPSAQAPTIAKTYLGQDGNVYGAVGARQFLLKQWTATELDPAHPAPAASRSTLSDGRVLTLSDHAGQLTLSVVDPKSRKQVALPVSYQGQELQLMRIAFGPDGVLYGSTAVPMDLVRADIATHRVEEIGYLGEGEVYSFLNHGNSLLMAAYAGPTVLMSYQPQTAFQLQPKPVNPRLIHFQGSSTSWRSMAMIDGPDGNVYVGSVAAYGLLNAPLIQWNPENDSIQQFNNIVNDQSIVSLAAWNDRIIGGTSIFGGEGAHATQKEARLFIWNPKTQSKEFDIAPVPGAPRITDLIRAPNNRIYGIAGHMYGVGPHTLFVFDPETRKVTKTRPLPFSSPIYNSVGLGDDGKIWGLAEEGIVSIDTESNQVELVARPPEKITGGFAMRGHELYFISGSTIYRYKM